MSISLNYDQVRALAKRLGDRVDREVKHTDVIADIAGVVGARPDIMMHQLKTEKRAEAGPSELLVSDKNYFSESMRGMTATKEELNIVADAMVRTLGAEVAARNIVEQFGFEWWETGGGCEAFRKTVRTEKIEGEESCLEISIATGFSGVDADPVASEWSATIGYTDIFGGEDLEDVGFSARDTGDKTLLEVLEHIEKSWMPRIDEFWDNNFDEERIKDRIAERRLGRGF